MTLSKKFLRIILRDRRREAVHQAGHVVVARHYGATNTVAWIARRTGPVDFLLECTWHGGFRLAKEGLTRVQITDIGLAGVAAEVAWDSITNERSSGFLPLDWTDWYNVTNYTETLGPADLSLAGRYEHGREDALVEDVIRLAAMLREQFRTALVKEARALIVANRQIASPLTGAALLDETAATRHRS
ncbi:hypothetical protein [Roseomonas harenae]|uniref:hypothetical protein n=1 Tax=Muricoccus harenae TaxID=2692566 RepID=UPI001331488C|nr:hypothetical protein [Roseomonas harenae]